MAGLSVDLLWQQLEKEAVARRDAARVYRAAGHSASGVRASFFLPAEEIELLVEVPADWRSQGVVPEWAGMGHELIDLALSPHGSSTHLRLYLQGTQYREVFVALCNDLVVALEGALDTKRRAQRLAACLVRWRRFFERTGADGLTLEMQQGLFAELLWMAHMLDSKLRPFDVVAAWKGCERNYHDFDWYGQVVEVKSTRGKEPRGVTINNELQLDDTGLISLHLYAVVLRQLNGGGMSLPEQVRHLQGRLQEEPAAHDSFCNSLLSAGYREDDAPKYTTRWVTEAEHLYRVATDFPRITALPAGIGDIRYRVLLGACERFKVDLATYIGGLEEAHEIGT